MAPAQEVEEMAQVVVDSLTYFDGRLRSFPGDRQLWSTALARWQKVTDLNQNFRRSLIGSGNHIVIFIWNYTNALLLS